MVQNEWEVGTRIDNKRTPKLRSDRYVDDIEIIVNYFFRDKISNLWVTRDYRLPVHIFQKSFWAKELQTSIQPHNFRVYSISKDKEGNSNRNIKVNNNISTKVQCYGMPAKFIIVFHNI